MPATRGVIQTGINQGAVRIFLNRAGNSRLNVEGFRSKSLSATSLASIFKANVDAELDLRVQLLAELLVTHLQDTTPVDTGIARANWQIAISRKYSVGHTKRIIYSEYFKRKAKRHGLRPGVVLPLPSRYAVGLTATDKFSVSRGDVGLILTNNLPYIRLLESGYSRQRPSGFIPAAVRFAINEVKHL